LCANKPEANNSESPVINGMNAPMNSPVPEKTRRKTTI